MALKVSLSKKGWLLLIGVAAITTCIVATIATGISTLQVVAGVALIAEAAGSYELYKSLKK